MSILEYVVYFVGLLFYVYVFVMVFYGVVYICNIKVSLWNDIGCFKWFKIGFFVYCNIYNKINMCKYIYMFF